MTFLQKYVIFNESLNQYWGYMDWSNIQGAKRFDFIPNKDVFPIAFKDGPVKIMTIQEVKEKENKNV